MEAFGILKRKIVSTPLLRGPDSQKSFVIIIHANPWAACAMQGQESDGVFFPVHITGRVLHDHKLRYLPAENEVVALIRALRVFRTMLAGTKLIKVYTRYSMLKWICTSRSLEGRCRQWAVCLAPWPLEILKVQQDDDGLAAIMGAEITPRDQLDQNADNLIPVTGRVIQSPPVRLEMLGPGCEGWLIRFDGHAKKSDRWGSAGCILWELLSWDVVQARGFHFADVTVNATEYHGMIEGSKMALVRGISELVIVGDSRIAIQQARGLIQCLKPRLRMFFSEFEDQRQEFKSIELVHVKRGFNAAANYLASTIWTIRHSFSIDNSLGLAQLRWLSRITEKLIRGQKTKRAEPNLEPSSVPDAKVDVVRGHVSLAQADECFSPKSNTFVITRSCTRAEKTPAEVEVVDPDSNVRDAAETAEAQARFILMQVGDELPEPNAQ